MNRTIKVLFLTQYYPPETGAPQARLSEMARRLSERGFSVEVLTAMPSYPLGRVFDGYRRRPWVVEHVDRTRVVHLPVLPSRSLRLLPRMASYLSFVLTSILLGPWLVSRPDVLVCESPPLFLGLSAAVLKLLFGCRLIFNVSDLWPESAVRMGLHCHPVLIWLARSLERFCYRIADATTGQSVGIVQAIRDTVPQCRTELLPNGCDCEQYRPERREEPCSIRKTTAGKLVVGYAGLIGRAQGVELLLDAADRLRDEPRICFVVVGDGPDRERLAAELALRQLANVVLTGWLPKHEMPAVVASFDMALVPLRYFIPGALPSKIYEAMASEVPVLLAADGDAKDLIAAADAGVALEFGDVQPIFATIRRLAADPAERRRLGANGRRYVLAHHQRRQIADRLGVIIESLIPAGGWGNREDLGRCPSHPTTATENPATQPARQAA